MLKAVANRNLPFDLLVVALLVPGAITGCNRGPAKVQVSGKVMYKDGSIPRGAVCSVQFVPTAESTAEVRNGASGSIEPDGTFKMYTRRHGDGVYLGEYAVTFAVWQNAMNPATSQILPIYANPKASPYKVKVEGDIDDLKFEIEPLPGVVGTAAGSGNAGT